MKKNILLTFDYELFQGKRSGSVKNCVLIPTEKILEILTGYHAKAIFFIDMMYLCRLKEVSEKYEQAKTDFEEIEKQIIKIAEQGHYVFNHLHPHWCDAEYVIKKNEWTLINDSKYAFQSLTENERATVFDRTMDLLNEILMKASRKFLADGYRAGGLYIQPFSIFKKYFDKYGIRYDFSVLKNAKGKLQNSDVSFDFSSVKKNIYRFDFEVTSENKNGFYTELAVGLVNIPFHIRVMNSIFYRAFSRSKTWQRYGDGLSTSNKISTTSKQVSNEAFSVEMLNPVKLPLYLQEVKQHGYLHLLSHPKLVSDGNLQTFDSLLKKLTASFDCEFDFKKFEPAE